MPAYRRLRMSRKHPQILGVDLNRSEPAGTRLALSGTGSEMRVEQLGGRHGRRPAPARQVTLAGIDASEIDCPVWSVSDRGTAGALDRVAQIAERKYCRPQARPLRLGYPRIVPVFPICSPAALVRPSISMNDAESYLSVTLGRSKGSQRFARVIQASRRRMKCSRS